MLLYLYTLLAQVDVDGEVYVSGGNIGGKYKTAQFHFHWGGNDMRGSEHTYNGQTFPMEVRIPWWSGDNDIRG